MKKHLALLLVILTVGSSMAQTHNTLSKKEKKEGWKLLFDGTTTKGWHDYNKPTLGEAWKTSNGEFWHNPIKGASDIVSNQEFENFELVLDWKIDSCGNSGIMFNVVEVPEQNFGYYTGPEMQILDNNCHPDGKFVKHRAGNLYDLIASPTESVKPFREWNTVKIISNKGHLEFWLNEVKQVETTMYTAEWEAMIKNSKFVNYPEFGKSHKGRILLQEHGSKVWFRNIKIKEL